MKTGVVLESNIKVKDIIKFFFSSPSVFIGWLIAGLGIGGEYLFLPFFVFLAIATILMGSLYAFFIYFFIYFSLPKKLFLNDEEGKIVTDKKRCIPYQRVKSIIITRINNFVSIRVYIGVFRPISFFASIEREGEIKSILEKRFLNIKIKKISFKLLNLVVSIIIPFLMMSQITFYYYKKYPFLKVFPTTLAQRSEVDLKREPNLNLYTYDSINFFLPGNFKLEKEDKEIMLFQSQNEQTVIVVEKRRDIDLLGKRIIFANFFLSLLRLNDDYDLYKVILNSRLGILPLTLKMFYLNKFYSLNFRKINIYEIRKDSFRGFLEKYVKIERKGNKKEMRRLLLVDKKEKRQIKFLISSQGKRDDLITRILIEKTN